MWHIDTVKMKHIFMTFESKNISAKFQHVMGDGDNEWGLGDTMGTWGQ